MFALAAFNFVKPLMHAERGTSIGKHIAERPETVGAAIWPYQSTAWNARKRLTRIGEHHSVIDKIGGPLDFSVNDRLVLLDLGEIRPGLSVVVDQPKWFIREGQLTISLFLDDTRLYSLVFSLFNDNGDIATFVGAIQGRDLDGILDEYRTLTKAAHGMRPRDFLIELFRMFCAMLGIKRIFAVADEYRQHRSPYYGKDPDRKLSVNYNEIWQDRGGTRIDSRVWQLDLIVAERDLGTVSAKKRPMYRRRYEMLKNIKQQMLENWRRLEESKAAI